MKISERFAGKFFKATDLDREGKTFEIFGVEDVAIRGEDKVILHFVDEDRMFPVNKTNALAIAEYLGDDTDEWAGNSVCLFRSNTTYQGKPVACVRARNPDLSADDIDADDIDADRDPGEPDEGSAKSKPMDKGKSMSMSKSKSMSMSKGKGKTGRGK
jgi:hypothetical protein